MQNKVFQSRGIWGLCGKLNITIFNVPEDAFGSSSKDVDTNWTSDILKTLSSGLIKMFRFSNRLSSPAKIALSMLKEINYEPNYKQILDGLNLIRIKFITTTLPNTLIEPSQGVPITLSMDQKVKS